MSENSNAGKIIISVLIGGAIGSALALLLPQNQEENKKRYKSEDQRNH